ncbi:MAG TPA: DHH family phosphoesterase [Candidatus Nitrosopolaris sp.]|nr:DHH family phosphoesterase [Candidatus Nitrosopolaris sp.]
MYGRGLEEAVKPFCEKLRSVTENDSSTCIMTHLEADGLISASIICMTLLRLGAKCVVRTISELTPAVIEQMKSEAHDFYIISDLGAGFAAMLSDTLGDRWIIIDHHQLPNEEFTEPYSAHILNPFKYSIDGGSEISSGGLAYILANQIEKRNWDLSPIAVVSAISDNQDQGDKNSLISLNSEIIKTAQSHGLITVDLDLVFTGRETKPLHEALASTSFPYIDGLTWNRENAYAVIKNSGVKMMENGRWRVLAEITQEDKSIILDAIVKFVATSSKYQMANLTESLVGCTYTLVNEDLRSQLRDAREFSALLNACGRTGRAGIGVGICMGDRYACLTEGEQIADTYRAVLAKSISTILTEKWRTTDNGRLIFVNGENVLSEEMLGAASSILSGSPTLGDRVLFVWSVGRDAMHRFSCRKCIGCKSGSDLGLAVSKCAETVGGIGGGHKAVARCKIPSSRLEDFISCARRSIIDFKNTNSS